MDNGYQKYYVPPQSKWPIVGALGLFFFAVGAAMWFKESSLEEPGYGPYIFLIGMLITFYMMAGWFMHVIDETYRGFYSKQMDRSFRWGMFWFIFSEVMFFAAFFGALFYARALIIPWLDGLGNNAATHEFLWPNFKGDWPLLNNPDPKEFPGPHKAMGAWPLPTINTLLLISSSFTVTWAHIALVKAKRVPLIVWMAISVFLGSFFLVMQGVEYHEAYVDLGLKLNSGIYGTTFFMLTGFHGAHVTIGTIILCFILFRCWKGHFTPENHFAFEAAAWYWHFVDVVWILLFIFVYILPIKAEIGIGLNLLFLLLGVGAIAGLLYGLVSLRDFIHSMLFPKKLF